MIVMITKTMMIITVMMNFNTTDNDENMANTYFINRLDFEENLTKKISLTKMSTITNQLIKSCQLNEYNEDFIT